MVVSKIHKAFHLFLLNRLLPLQPILANQLSKWALVEEKVHMEWEKDMG